MTRHDRESWTLSRKRLAPVGGRGPGAPALAARAACVATVAALTYAIIAVVRPLPIAPVPAPVELPGSDHSGSSVEDRQAAMREATDTATRLAGLHLFSMRREPLGWAPTVAASLTPAETGSGLGAPDDDPQDPTPSARRTQQASSEGGARYIEPDDLDAVDDEELKLSFRSIRLLGVYVDRAGDARAMLAFSHAVKDRPALLKAGSSFEPPNASSNKRDPIRWTLDAVDTERDRVLISARDTTLAIALFPTSDTLRSPFEMTRGAAAATGDPLDVERDGAATAPEGTVIVEQDMSDVIEELRESGHEADLAEIFRLMGMQGMEETDQRDRSGSGAEGTVSGN